MLPEVGGTEWLVIAAAALILIGPKDLPPLMRKIGQFVGKMRGMASEFRMSFDEMARQSELEELRKEVNAMRAERPFGFDDDAMRFKDPGVAPVYDSPAMQTAATEADLAPAPLAEPQEPTLFDMDAPQSATPPEKLH